MHDIVKSGISLCNLYFLICFFVFFNNNFLGPKPKSKPKKERTEEEKKFRRRAKYFLTAQLISVLVFLSVFGGSDSGEVDFDEGDEGIDYFD